MGWPRYADMAVVLACFALTLPVFSLPRVSQQLAYALLILVVLMPTFPKVSPSWRNMGYVPFRPADVRQARAHVVAEIEELRRQGPIDLVSRHSGEYLDVDFNLDECMNFNRKNADDSASAGHGVSRRRIALINYQWATSCVTLAPGNEREKIEFLLGEKIVSVPFSEGLFELVETRGLPPAVRIASSKPAGAFLSAAPNPVPAGTGLGSSIISWDTGDGTIGEVVRSTREIPEEAFGSGARGTKAATGLVVGIAYEFRLYAGAGQKRLLDTVRVTRNCQ